MKEKTRFTEDEIWAAECISELKVEIDGEVITSTLLLLFSVMNDFSNSNYAVAEFCSVVDG